MAASTTWPLSSKREVSSMPKTVVYLNKCQFVSLSVCYVLPWGPDLGLYVPALDFVFDTIER